MLGLCAADARFQSTGLERSAALAEDIAWMQQEYALPATQPGDDGPGLAYSRCPHPLRMFSAHESAGYRCAALLCTLFTNDPHDHGHVSCKRCEGSNTCHAIYGMPQSSNHEGASYGWLPELHFEQSHLCIIEWPPWDGILGNIAF